MQALSLRVLLFFIPPNRLVDGVVGFRVMLGLFQLIGGVIFILERGVSCLFKE